MGVSASLELELLAEDDLQRRLQRPLPVRLARVLVRAALSGQIEVRAAFTGEAQRELRHFPSEPLVHQAPHEVLTGRT